jgi:hypothetical protein
LGFKWGLLLAYRMAGQTVSSSVSIISPCFAGTQR